MSLAGKTIFITGGSRGIGLAIALRAAADGANIAIAAKTAEAHPTLPGTIHTAAEAIEQAGGKALALQCDIRDEDQVEAAVSDAAAHFGGIDACINNASAISLTPTLGTPMKRYDLMHDINVRGTFLVSRACLPHLLEAANPHILTLSPPLDLDPKWFAPNVAYTMSKMAMSMCTLGLSAEFRDRGVAANSLWPLTTIDTAAVRHLPGGQSLAARSRSPQILADAAHAILTRPAGECTGNFFIDEAVLRQEGITDFAQYANDPGQPPFLDYFVPDDVVQGIPTEVARLF